MIRGHRWPGDDSRDSMLLLQTVVCTVVLLASLDQTVDACAVQPDAFGHVHVTSNVEVTVNSFNNCSGLVSVTISNAVTDIGDFAFFGCTQLFAVTLPDSLQTIGRLAFFECPLTTINIPLGTQIGLGAFESGLCGNLYSSGQSLCNCGSCSPTAAPTPLLQPNGVPTMSPTTRPSASPASVAPSLQPSSQHPTFAQTSTPLTAPASPATSAPAALPTTGVGIHASSPTAQPSYRPTRTVLPTPHSESTSTTSSTSASTAMQGGPVQTRSPTAEPTQLRTQPGPPASQTSSSYATAIVVSISVFVGSIFVCALLLLAWRRFKLSKDRKSDSNTVYELESQLMSDSRDADKAETASMTYNDKLVNILHELAKPRGLELGMFQVETRIGRRANPVCDHRYEGCNSCVFEAILENSGAAAAPSTILRVALKVIYNIHATPANALSKQYAADFSITKKIPGDQHPNIVRYLGHFKGTASRKTLGNQWDVDGIVREHTLFVVLEYLDVSLKQLIGSRLGLPRQSRVPDVNSEQVAPWPPVLSVPEFLLILQRLLRAICYLIRYNIVHRDIKPDNILLAGDGLEKPVAPTAQGAASVQPNSPRRGTVRIVKLADFDQALDTSQYKGKLCMPLINSDVSRGGAPGYLAPEVMSAEVGTDRNVRYIDYSKNDVFAAGLVAYDMVTSGTQDPFTEAHPHRNIKTYSDLPSGCPTAISDLVWAMMNPDFDRRITARKALDRVDLLMKKGLEWREMYPI